MFKRKGETIFPISEAQNLTDGRGEIVQNFAFGQVTG